MNHYYAFGRSYKRDHHCAPVSVHFSAMQAQMAPGYVDQRKGRGGFRKVLVGDGTVIENLQLFV